jgi:hypothetical protein
MTVRGRLRERKTGLNLRCTIDLSRVTTEEPGHKVDGTDGHADAEDHAGEGAFGPAFSESKHEASYHDGDEREARGDRASEGRLQDLHGLRPG